MVGDDRSRFCGRCESRVYDFSGMTRAEIERLLEEKEGGVCARMYRRSDGTILTRDCPIGVARARRWWTFWTGLAGTLVSATLGWFLPSPARPEKEPETVAEDLRSGEPEPVESTRCAEGFLMGYIDF